MNKKYQWLWVIGAMMGMPIVDKKKKKWKEQIERDTQKALDLKVDFGTPKVDLGPYSEES